MQLLTDTSAPSCFRSGLRRLGLALVLPVGVAAMSVSAGSLASARAASVSTDMTAIDDGHQPVRPAWLASIGPDGRSLPATAAVASPVDDAHPHSLADRVGAAWQQRLHSIRGKVRAVASWTEHGVATWYGSWHKGRRTSSGAVFNPALMTAAHPSLPLGTRLLVTNTTTGDSVVVTVNDREPKHPNSIIDLSRGAASRLGFVSSGRAAVKLTRLEPGQDPVEVADAPDGVSGPQPAPEGAAMGLPAAD